LGTLGNLKEQIVGMPMNWANEKLKA
jgi:hypothetical protein